jgi:hypothetical protein
MENSLNAADALMRLEGPFASKDVKWLVAATSRDCRKNRVTPYADPRAYTDRLNQVFHRGGLDQRIRGPHRFADHPIKERQANSDSKGAGDLCRFAQHRKILQGIVHFPI